MRVLFITNRFPGQRMRGDQLRAYQQIRLLSARHRITLLSFSEPEGDARDTAELEACCERIVIAPRARMPMAWRALIALPTRLPLQVAAFDSVPARAGLEALLRDGRFDVAHVQLARLGPMLRRLAPLPCVLDLVDALSLNMARRALIDHGPIGWIAGIEAKRLARYERALCAQADVAAVCSAPDRDAIGARDVQLVRNGVDLAQFAFVPDGARGNTLVFVGNLGYFPNVDAAVWFATEVMPRVRAGIADAQFQLVGARPAPRLRQLAAQCPGVVLIGPVAEVQPYLRSAAIAVVPLRSGSGQQLKLIEAMAAGTPTVATSLSAAGLDARDGEHVLIADDADAMAAAVLRLLADAPLRLRLANAARALVEQAHSWESSTGDLEQCWITAAKASR